MRNGSVTPREEGFAKQTQDMLLGEWSADAVTAEAYPVSIKLEALLRRYSWKKVLQNYSRISYGLHGRRMSPNHVAISGSAAKTAPQNLFVCRAPVGEHIWNELEGIGTSFNHTFLCFGAERECGCTSRVHVKLGFL